MSQKKRLVLFPIPLQICKCFRRISNSVKFPRDLFSTRPENIIPDSPQATLQMASVSADTTQLCPTAE